jgi:hypothetical protein
VIDLSVTRRVRVAASPGSPSVKGWAKRCTMVTRVLCLIQVRRASVVVGVLFIAVGCGSLRSAEPSGGAREGGSSGAESSAGRGAGGLETGGDASGVAGSSGSPGGGSGGDQGSGSGSSEGGEAGVGMSSGGASGWTCGPDPNDAPGPGVSDSHGCTYEGDVTVPGRMDLSGVRVVVAGTVLSTVTDAEGHYVLEGVPAGTQRLHFSFGDFHQTIPEVRCVAGGGPLVEIKTLADERIELYAGTRISDGGPARLAPDTDDRVFFDYSNRGVTSTFVVDHECAPSVAFPCAWSTAPSEDGSKVLCFDGSSMSAFSVPRDATQFEPLVVGAQGMSVRPEWRYIAYAKDGSVHVLKVQDGVDHILGSSGAFGFQMTADEGHVLFVDDAGDLRLGDTAAAMEAAVVDTLIRPPPGFGSTFTPQFSPDGRYVAYVPGACDPVCELRLLNMEGDVRSLGTLHDIASFGFSPNSDFVVAMLDSNDVIGFPTAGGDPVPYTQAINYFVTFIPESETVAISASGTTTLYDLTSGESLGALAASIRATTPDGRLLFVIQQTGDPPVTSLATWDSVTLETNLLDVDGLVRRQASPELRAQARASGRPQGDDAGHRPKFHSQSRLLRGRRSRVLRRW